MGKLITGSSCNDLRSNFHGEPGEVNPGIKSGEESLEETRSLGRLIYYDSTGREITVPFGPEQPLVTIGRATDCTIQSNRKSVSRHHAEFRFNNGQYEIVDLNSSDRKSVV